MCLSYLVIVFFLVCTAYWEYWKQKCIGNSIHISGTRQQSHHTGGNNLHSKWALGLERMGCPHGGAMAFIQEIIGGRLIPLFHFYEEAQYCSKMAGPHKSQIATYCPKEQAHLVLPTVSLLFALCIGNRAVCSLRGSSHRKYQGRIRFLQARVAALSLKEPRSDPRI